MMKRFTKNNYLILILVAFLICGLDFYFTIKSCEPNWHNFISFVVATLTLVLLAVYTYDTRRMANNSEIQLIRPIIFREGIFNWDVNSISKLNNNRLPLNLTFKCIKNIALEVRGQLILNKKKYELKFANQASVSNKSILNNSPIENKIVIINLFDFWGWLPENSDLWATYDDTKGVDCNEDNSLILTYSDIEGNKYEFKENSKNTQINTRK